LLSFTPKSHILFIKTLLDSTPAFKDALTLLRVWANQRGYGESKRPCVRGFEGKGTWWACLLGTLIDGENLSDPKRSRKALGKGLSSYQLFRAALDFLGECASCFAESDCHFAAKHDWEKEMVFMKGHKVPSLSLDALFIF
jgi:U3 small nucleolar RNA-associated protein 22